VIAGWIINLTGSLEDRKRYRAYTKRLALLPENYRVTVGALERYLVRAGSVVRAAVLVQMLEDLGELFEQAAAHGASVRNVIGDDPNEFVDVFAHNYSDGQWFARERRRLTEAMARTDLDGGNGAFAEGYQTSQA